MKKLLVILDPAHGEEVPGKRSPDGKHREYRWSRERLRDLAPKLEALGYTVVWTNTTEKEIGLSARKNAGTLLANQHPNLVPFLLSLHNDASGNGSKWMQASGISVWTSKGRTTSDIFADYFISAFKQVIPEVKHRQYSPAYLDRDFEENFTVLLGNYSAMLIECMFQDNRDDVELLSDAAFNAKVISALVKGFELCNNYITTKS